MEEKKKKILEDISSLKLKIVLIGQTGVQLNPSFSWHTLKLGHFSSNEIKRTQMKQDFLKDLSTYK